MNSVGPLFVYLAGWLSIISFFLPFFDTPAFGTWTLKNYPKVLSFGYIHLYTLPSTVAIIVSVSVLLSTLFSEKIRLWISRILGLVLFLIGLVLAIVLVPALPFLVSVALPDTIAWHQGTGAYLVYVAHSLIGIGGFFMLVKPGLSQAPKQSASKKQNTAEPVTLAEREGLRKRKPAKQELINAGASSDSPVNTTEEGFTSPTMLLSLLNIALCGVFLWKLVFSVQQLDTCTIDLSDIILPPGFQVHSFAEGVPEARSMARSPSGMLFVGTRKAGSFYAVIDKDKDFKADLVLVLGTNMEEPNGVAFKDGSLYLAEISRLWRYNNIEETLSKVIANTPNETKLIELPPESLERELLSTFPESPLHGWRYLAFGPDGRMYVAIGAPCNVCYQPDDPIFSTIIRQSISSDWKNWDIFAAGVRNSLGFDWHPQTKEMWFTENGRDFADHDLPPDELNVAPTSGLHFGFPWCFGSGVEDTDIQKNHSIFTDCSQYQKSKQNLQPHAAALGMKFYRGQMFPKEYHHAIFIAEHGSWNRPPPLTGYRVSLVKLSGESLSYEQFAGGFVRKDPNFLSSEQGCGRPVDILELPDGSLLVSDDHNSRIYRITYNPQ